MKKSLKWLAAACASAMLLSGAMVPAAMASDSTEQESTMDFEEYLLSQLQNAIPLKGGYVFVPGRGRITEDEYYDLYQRLVNYHIGTILQPSYPTWWYPNYPGYGSSSAPSFLEKDLTLKQFETVSLGFGNGYYYTSTDEDVVTVNSYGLVYAAGPGEAVIAVSTGLYTYVLVHVTVEEVDIEDTDLTISMSVSDTSLEIGDTATVRAYLTRYNSYYWQNGFLGEIELSVSDDSVLSLDGNTITALAEGSSYVTATLKNTDLSESVLVQVYEDLAVVNPYYPSYPSYPNYNYPWFDYNYPWYDYDYPWYNYPWYGIEIAVPNFNTSVNVNWAKLLDVDTDVYDLEYEYTYTGGSWMRSFTLVPKDGTSVSSYETEYKRINVVGKWETVILLTPSDYTAEVEKEEPKVEIILTPEEIEALEKAEAEAKRQAELKEKIALAMEGELEWYEVYGDLYGDSYYNNAVKFALENQYVVGNEDGTFGSADAVTYGYVADVLCKFLTLTPEELEESAIIIVEDADKEITREEMAVVLQNVANKMELENSGTVDLTGFEDYDELDSDKADAFGWALRCKLLNKNSDSINPNGTVDKARLCQMLYVLTNLAK